MLRAETTKFHLSSEGSLTLASPHQVDGLGEGAARKEPAASNPNGRLRQSSVQFFPGPENLTTE